MNDNKKQKLNLWIKRRIPQYLDLMEDIILEGFEYITPCDYGYEGGYKDFHSDIIMSAAITFANSLDGIDNLGSDDGNIVSEIVYDYMEKNYGDLILTNFMDRIGWCD
jgi:hypothetical protein